MATCTHFRKPGYTELLKLAEVRSEIMKTIVVVLGLCLAVALPLFAEMSDSAAKEKAILTSA